MIESLVAIIATQNVEILALRRQVAELEAKASDPAPRAAEDESLEEAADAYESLVEAREAIPNHAHTFIAGAKYGEAKAWKAAIDYLVSLNTPEHTIAAIDLEIERRDRNGVV